MAESSIIKMIINAENNASRIFSDVDKSIGSLDRSFGGLGGRAVGLAKGIAEVTAVLGGLAIAFGAFSAKEAAEFETAMGNIDTLLSGIQENDLPDIEEGILDLTRTVPQLASSLAGAFYDIQSGTGAGAEVLKTRRRPEKRPSEG